MFRFKCFPGILRKVTVWISMGCWMHAVDHIWCKWVMWKWGNNIVSLHWLFGAARGTPEWYTSTMCDCGIGAWNTANWTLEFMLTGRKRTNLNYKMKWLTRSSLACYLWWLMWLLMSGNDEIIMWAGAEISGFYLPHLLGTKKIHPQWNFNTLLHTLTFSAAPQ